MWPKGQQLSLKSKYVYEYMIRKNVFSSGRLVVTIKCESTLDLEMKIGQTNSLGWTD